MAVVLELDATLVLCTFCRFVGHLPVYLLLYCVAHSLAFLLACPLAQTFSDSHAYRDPVLVMFSAGQPHTDRVYTAVWSHRCHLNPADWRNYLHFDCECPHGKGLE